MTSKAIYLILSSFFGYMASDLLRNVYYTSESLINYCKLILLDKNITYHWRNVIELVLRISNKETTNAIY